MRPLTTKWSLAVAAAALLALPVATAAQTPPSAPPTAQPPAAQQPAKAGDPAKTDAAREHLAKAKAALDEITAASLSAGAKTQIAEVKRRLNTLERSVAANDSASATGTEQRDPKATAGARGTANWGNEVAAIDKVLTSLLGPEAGTGAPAATGTSGPPAQGKAAAVTLDEASRAKLTEVRTHVTAFATVMAGGTPRESSPEPAAEPAQPPATTPPTEPPATTPPATTPPPTQPTPTGTSGTTPDPAQPPSGMTQPPAQPEKDAARRHLTEARNTLSALTQLPAASQLSGEARTQVSQLISNFNELITANADWKASYAKVSASLMSLIGPEAAATPEPSGTPGAVGTSGTATANMDPSIREKLVELRRNLSEFEKAAGGTAASTQAGEPPPEDPPSTTPPATAPPATTPPSGTPPSTPPSATPPSGTPPSTPPSETPEPGAAGAQPAGNAELMRHVAAIEALLKLEDDSGGLTLTKAQVEQLRSHWTALKQALEKK